MAAVDRIPVILLSGFLGSGKTTLLGRAIRDPGAAGTLVVVNELGEVGLDHDLLWQGGEVPLVLDSGCICCSVSDDLLTMLEELFWARLHRTIPRFERIVIETTGLADPRPVIAALRDRPLVAERYRYAGTVTVVDAAAGLARLDEAPEAAAQVAVADRLIVSKTDLASTDRVRAVREALARLTPLATIEESVAGSAGRAELFAEIEPHSPDAAAPAHGHAHVSSLTVPLAPMADAAELTAALERLAALAPRLMRAKGIARCAGVATLAQVVGASVSPPEPYRGRQDSVATERLVVIGQSLDAEEVRAALGPVAQSEGADAALRMGS